MTVWGGSEAGGRWRTWPGKNEKGLRGRGLSGSSAFASVDGRPRFAFAASSSFFCLVVLFCVCVWCVGCVEWAGWEKDRIEERDRERVRASGCACVGARVRGSAGACVRVRTCVGSWVAGWVRECACARFAHSHTRDFCMIWVWFAQLTDNGFVVLGLGAPSGPSTGSLLMSASSNVSVRMVSCFAFLAALAF